MLWRAVVRTDPRQGKKVRQSKAMERSAAAAARALQADGWGKDSLSGKERNRLFLNESGKQFADVSLLSGADDKADGRSVAVWDYNGDGWPDLALANANAPKLALFANQLFRYREARERGRIAFRFTGGNGKAMASEDWSSRDGYGVRVELSLPGGATILREHRCGEGFAAQNSATLLVGLGSALAAKSVRVTWPSGKVQELGTLSSGSLIQVFENPAESPPTKQSYGAGQGG